MAQRVREDHLKEKNISALSTPRRISPSPNGDTTMAQEKPVPNYLKPTISSSHDTSSCKCPKIQQQHPKDSTTAAAARKRLITSIKPIEKPDSPSSLPHKTPEEKKPSPWKALKASAGGKTPLRAKSLPKSRPKRREANGNPCTTSPIKSEQRGKALSIDTRKQGQTVRHGSQSPKITSSEESDTGKPRAPPGKVTKKASSNEGKPRKLKFQQNTEQEGGGKKAVGEKLKRLVKEAVERKVEQERQELKEKGVGVNETVTQPATRRSQVRALVGALESNNSLQAPGTQQRQQEKERAVKVGRVRQPEGEAKGEEESGEETSKGGQLDQEAQ